MILGIHIEGPDNQFQLHLKMGNQDRNNRMIPNTNKIMSIGRYSITIVGNTINITNYIVIKVLYQKEKEGKLNKVKRMFTVINDISYSVGKTKKISEQNTVVKTYIVAQSTKQEPKEINKIQCNSAKRNQGNTLKEVTIYL